MKKTLAELVLSAQAAANQARTLATGIEQQTAKLEAFKAGNFHNDDFLTWENAFNAQLEMLTVFARQFTPASNAAAKISVPTAPAAAS